MPSITRNFLTRAATATPDPAPTISLTYNTTNIPNPHPSQFQHNIIEIHLQPDSNSTMAASLLRSSAACSSWRCITNSSRSHRPIASFATDANVSVKYSNATVRSRKVCHYHSLATPSSPSPCILGKRSKLRQFSSTSSVEPRKDALTSSDGVVGYPIDFDTASSVEGKESQVRLR